jgi:hypothetical protein
VPPTATDDGGVEDGAADGLLHWKMLGAKALSDGVFEGLDDGWAEGLSVGHLDSAADVWAE